MSAATEDQRIPAGPDEALAVVAAPRGAAPHRPGGSLGTAAGSLKTETPTILRPALPAIQFARL